MTLEEKWQLLEELEEDVMAGDPTAQQPLKAEIVSLLEARRQHYLQNPQSASTWEDVSRRMLLGNR